MNHVKSLATLSVACLLLLLLVAWAPAARSKKVSSETAAKEMAAKTAAPAASANDQLTNANMQLMLDQGRQTFRYDTFGDEAFWGGALHLQEAIAGDHLGGAGPGVSPKTALSVGLKVDADALPASLVEQIKAGKVIWTIRQPPWRC